MTNTTELETLNASTLSAVTGETAKRPPYDRDALPISILHVGPGAFFRAHQMDYYDRLNATDPQWGVMAVALRSRKAPDALAEQSGLYTLVTLDREIDFRVIGCLKEVCHKDDAQALAPFTSAELKLVTLTITEKGYCLKPDGNLDETHADIAADLKDMSAPLSAIGWLVKGLSARKDAGLSGITILSCDNLPSNGEKLESAVLQFAGEIDPALRRWIEDEVSFPSSMVDSITPATDDALINRVERECGYHDEWPIQREAFTSWVVQSNVKPGFPDIARVGAIMTDDVALHEKAKLWLLNGPHSTLAYLGLAYGCKSVAEGMTRPELKSFLDSLMRDEILPGLTTPDGMDLNVYIDDLLDRFSNPAIEHKLSQIAWDGSKKLPIRLLETISGNLAAGRSVEKLSFGIAAWMRFIVRMTRAEASITDPMASELAALGAKAEDKAETDVPMFLAVSAVFDKELTDNTTFTDAVKQAYSAMLDIENTNLQGGFGI